MGVVEKVVPVEEVERAHQCIVHKKALLQGVDDFVQRHEVEFGYFSVLIFRLIAVWQYCVENMQAFAMQPAGYGAKAEVFVLADQRL